MEHTHKRPGESCDIDATFQEHLRAEINARRAEIAANHPTDPITTIPALIEKYEAMMTTWESVIALIDEGGMEAVAQATGRDVADENEHDTTLVLTAYQTAATNFIIDLQLLALEASFALESKEPDR